MSIFSLDGFFAKGSNLSYEQMWQKVKTAQQDDLPQQVLKEAQHIYDKAAGEKNFPQLFKSWITLIETRSNIDPDSFKIDMIKPIPHEGAVQTAIYNAVMATAYLEMTDTSINDFDEETCTDYITRADSLFKASIADYDALSAESALDYLPLIVKGKDSRLYNHDLLSVLTRFAFDHSRMTNSEKAEITANMAKFYEMKGNREAATLLQLDNINYRRSHEDYKERLLAAPYQAELLALLTAAQGLEAYADIAQQYVETIYDDERIDFCRRFLTDCPKAYNANFFTGIIDGALRPELRLNIPDDILADCPFRVELRYENLNEASFVIRKFNGYTDKYQREPRQDGQMVWQRQYTLCDDSLNIQRHAKGYATQGSLDHDVTLSAGHYVFITKAAGKQEVSDVSITSMRLLLFHLPDDKIMAVVRNNKTGRPMPNAVLHMQDNLGNDATDLTCDQNGEVIFTEKRNYRYWAFLPGTDDRTAEITAGYQPSFSDDHSTVTHYQLFTDRAIYRPSQTVHVSGIAYTQKDDETQVLANSSVEVTLFDANYRKQVTKQVESNSLGSFDADFVLPQGVLPGQFRIECDGTRTYFRVEEYKRPTFEVEVRQTTTQGNTFTFGDTIQIETIAKTYAGVPVQGAKAHYKIETAEVSFWRWWDTNWNLLSEQDVTTDDDGKARVPLYLDPAALNESDYSLVQYRVTFDVTDQAGETRSAHCQFALSRRTFALSVKAPTTLDLSDASQQVVIEAINANHEPVSCSGTYTLCVSDETDTKPLQQGTFQAGQALTLPRLTAGSYTLKAVATDRDGTPVKVEQTFTVFDSKQALAPARFTTDFLLVTRSTFSQEQDAELFFSPAEGDVLLGYHLLSNDRLIERHQLNLDHQIVHLRFPYRPEYGDGVSLQLYYVRNGHLCSERRSFSYVKPDKKLKLSWSTFRDRLYPGQDEEWILTISDPQGRPVSGAELLATMYDASLDALSPHSWSFATNYNRNIRRYTSNSTHGNHSYGATLHAKLPNRSYQERKFDELTEYIHDRWTRASRFMGRMRSRNVLYSTAMPMVEETMACNEDDGNSVASYAPSLKQAMASVGDVCENLTNQECGPMPAPEAETPTLRTNFAETAFFLPHLLSDEQGQVHVSFTLPESLTEWRFIGLAHDRDVRYGNITATTVARKDFMVQPNMPRFVREGDHASIAARVINQCDHDLSGTVRFRLLNAETEQVVYTSEQPVKVEEGKTAAITFDFQVDDCNPMLICEIIGTAGSSSDGERNFLPILSSRKYITESVPFYVMADNNDKQIDLHELFNHGSITATQRRLILEYTQHPEWTIIEALDGIKLPDYDNAPGFAASLYANTIASRLAQSIPGFEQAISEAQASLPNSQSQLELNDDLRDILLKESPWVIDALHETEQRARLIDLFDQEKMQQRTSKALERLQRLQKSDGSWSWFEGMEGSFYITLSTCESLIGLCEFNPDVNCMVRKALDFLDAKEYKAYQEQKKQKQPLYVDEGTQHYLYICSTMPDRKVSKDILKMRNEMLDVIAKSVRDLTILGRSQAACTLRAFGRTKEADKFLQSAVEYTISKPGMGRFYATDIAYYSWRDYRIPTQLAAMRAIEASTRTDKHELLREMQIWLLRQKQTQTWDNPINTIAAVQFLLGQSRSNGEASYAATMTGNQKASLPAFQLDATPLPTAIDTTKFLADQLGYIRTQISNDILDHGVTTLEITQSPSIGDKSAANTSISWGAVYAQYMEQIDQLQNQTSGELSVEVRYLDAEGKAIDPATTTLHVGQRVTMRLVVKADRDMDFVQVRCQRPACFEPVEQHSGYCWMGGRGGYVALHDASTDVFFDRFTRGTSTFDLQFTVDRSGVYLSGIATAQCAYATEYCAHSSAVRLSVK